MDEHSMFLLAVVGRTVIKSMVFNTAFILLMRIFSMILLDFVKILPLQFLQVIPYGQKKQYMKIVIGSILKI